MIYSMRGIDRASHTMKDGVKDDSMSLQALAENLMLFSRSLQLEFRTCIFTVLNEVQKEEKRKENRREEKRKRREEKKRKE